MEDCSLYCLIFTSLSAGLMVEEELMSLADQLQARCHAWNVTGVLLYMETRFLNKLEGRFLLMLEGREAQVKAGYVNLSNENWHKAHITLHSGQARQRYFQRWSLGFKISGIKNYLHDSSCFHLNDNFLEYLNEAPDDSRKELLRSFYLINQEFYVEAKRSQPIPVLNGDGSFNPEIFQAEHFNKPNSLSLEETDS